MTLLRFESLSLVVSCGIHPADGSPLSGAIWTLQDAATVVRVSGAQDEACPDAVEVPWRTLPISEPLLPGERSTALREAQGWPVYVPALIATLAGVSTTEARHLLLAGAVTIEGAAAGVSFQDVRPGAVVRVGEDRCFRLGPLEG